jgi:hypothetical protein
MVRLNIGENGLTYCGLGWTFSDSPDECWGNNLKHTNAASCLAPSPVRHSHPSCHSTLQKSLHSINPTLLNSQFQMTRTIAWHFLILPLLCTFINLSLRIKLHPPPPPPSLKVPPWTAFPCALTAQNPGKWFPEISNPGKSWKTLGDRLALWINTRTYIIQPPLTRVWDTE